MAAIADKMKCIVLATRPLVMWILMLSVPPNTLAHDQLPMPIIALLQKSAESANNMLTSLKRLSQEGLLGKSVLIIPCIGPKLTFS